MVSFVAGVVVGPLGRSYDSAPGHYDAEFPNQSLECFWEMSDHFQEVLEFDWFCCFLLVVLLEVLEPPEECFEEDVAYNWDWFGVVFAMVLECCEVLFHGAQDYSISFVTFLCAAPRKIEA